MASRFALDQNFPDNALRQSWPDSLSLVRLGTFRPDLVRGVEDWEILLELQHEGLGGFITNDEKMLRAAREMVALANTQLTLVVTSGTGHDPMKATGLLLMHLRDIAVDSASRPLVYVLRMTGKSAKRPGAILNEIATARGVAPNLLRTQEAREIRQLVQKHRAHLDSLTRRAPTAE